MHRGPGGATDTTRAISLFRPEIADAALAAATDVLRSGWPGPGPVVEQFEEAFARTVEAPHAVAVSSGTAALHLALLLLGIGPGDEVVTSPITFVGANEVILHTGATAVFADVHPDRGDLDLDSVAACIGPRTRAVIATHLGGVPVDLDELYDLAGRAGIAVVEDAAHACGSTYRGAPIGSHPGTQVFSFQATKNLTAVDGGMICLRSGDDAARARRLRWMGIDKDTWSRSSSTYRWAYDVAEVGHRYSMNDLNAAIALAHLPLLPEANARRRAIAERYRHGLAGLDGVTILEPPTDRTSATCLAAILVDRRDAVVDRLGRAGIETGVHYRRNDQHPLFGEPRDLPGAQAYWTRTLSLPLHLELTDQDVDAVIDGVRQAVTHG